MTTRGDAVQVVLVRHGETDWNVQRRWQGQQGEGLNARGRAQAEAVARRLAQEFGPERGGAVAVRAPLLLASDLARCRETADIVAAALGVPVLHEARLREIDVGTWSGLTHTEVAEMDPNGRQPWRLATDVRLGGAESVADVQRRVGGLLEDLVAGRIGRSGGEDDRGPDTVIAITHGGVIRIGTAALLDMPSVDPLEGCANGSITRWNHSRSGTWRLASYDSTEHLRIADVTAAGADPAGAVAPTEFRPA